MKLIHRAGPIIETWTNEITCPKCGSRYGLTDEDTLKTGWWFQYIFHCEVCDWTFTKDRSYIDYKIKQEIKFRTFIRDHND